MGFWQRLKMLFSSNFNAILDKAEDPHMALDQLTRDMTVEVRSAKAHLADAIVNLKKLERDYEKHAAIAKDYEEKARIILTDDDESNDYLAKEALLRKRENEGVAAQYKTAADRQRTSVETLRRNIEKMERKVGDASRQKVMLKTQSQIADTQARIIEATTNAGTGTGAFEEYNRIEEKIRDKTERVQVEAELAQVGKIDEQLEDLHFGHEVDQEFEALKKKIALEAPVAPKELPPAR